MEITYMEKNMQEMNACKEGGGPALLIGDCFGKKSKGGKEELGSEGV